MKDQQSGTLAVILDFVKSLIWPLLILFLFMTYRHEITEIIESLPSKIRKASKFSAGSISFEIEKAAVASGNEELASLLGGLSPSAVNALIHLGDMRYSPVKRNDKDRTYQLVDEYPDFLELERNGLATGSESLAEFERFFNELPHTSETVYKSIKERGAYSYKKSQDNPTASQIIYVKMDQMTEKDEKRIRDFTVRLNKKGMLAYKIILQVVSEQIGAKPQ